MLDSSDPATSLISALSRQRENPAALGAFKVILRRYLDDDETVYLALEGNGWTWVDPLILVTDRRVLHLQRGVLGFWRRRREIPAAEVAGASIRTGLFFGTVTVSTHRGRRIRMWYDTEGFARDFVNSLNELVSGNRR